MGSYNNILLEVREGVVLLTLNHPESRNPLTEETKNEIISVLEEAASQKAWRALVMTGKGVAFCAGGDVKNIGKELSEEEIRSVMGKSQQLLRRLLELEKPVIAAVNGDAFGMGCNLALASDFAVASEKARFCQVFINLGLAPDFGALYFLPRLIGMWKSKEMTYLGRVIAAGEALEMGLIYKMVSHDALEKEAMDLAARLAGMPTVAIGRAKRMLNRSFDMTLEEMLAEEIKAQISLTRTEDHREGIRALMERRKPQFQGR